MDAKKNPSKKKGQKSLRFTLMSYGAVAITPYLLVFGYASNFYEGDTAGLGFLAIPIPAAFVTGLLGGALANLFTLSNWVPYLAALVGGALPYWFLIN